MTDVINGYLAESGLKAYLTAFKKSPKDFGEILAKALILFGKDNYKNLFIHELRGNYQTQ